VGNSQLRLAVTAVVAAAGLALPATGQGTATVGSSLERAPTGVFPSARTFALDALNASLSASGGFASPVNGTVVRWRIRAGGMSSSTAFRIVKRAGSNLFAGAGTSASVIPTVNQISVHETRLPVEIGDLIGIDQEAPGGTYVVPVNFANTVLWNTTLADGVPTTPDGSEAELAVNADIEPTSAFRAKRKPLRRGRVRITATFPNPGIFRARDNRLAKRKWRLRPVTSQVGAPGELQLVVKPTRRALRQLRRKARRLGRRRARIRAPLRLVFQPAFGTPRTEVIRVKLRL
jgi:hypothetical protein